MTSRRPMSRRGLFKLGAGTSTAVALAIAGRANTTAAPAGARFDLTAASTELVRQKGLNDKTVLQSFAFDNDNQHIYTVQLKNGSGSGAAGNLCVTKLSPSGAVLGHMYLMGFGHGVQIGVEPSGSTAHLWTETDAAPSDDNDVTQGTRLARFEFADSQTLTTSSSALTKYTLIPGATKTTPAIDPSTNCLTMRYHTAGVFRYAAFDLTAIRAGRATKLYDVAEPEGLGTFQGHTTYGDYLYMLSGDPYSASNPAPGNTHITCLDLGSGQQIQHALSQAGQSLDYREPEGMAIQIAAGAPRLCFGFASGPAGARVASIYYKTKVI
ncbi:hypothetical protein [Nocardia brasiliensis]|uniref:phage baseplate protein n=1 Tax=Nocardia brasiliensis TaxID=37326 RepID=UPI0024540B35|nr:hypothetical protein [Nocardia brasiliensis]